MGLIAGLITIIITGNPLAGIVIVGLSWFFYHRKQTKSFLGSSLSKSQLYKDLLRKARGDEALVERLIDYERKRTPELSEQVYLKRALERWERDRR